MVVYTFNLGPLDHELTYSVSDIRGAFSLVEESMHFLCLVAT